MCVCVYTIGDNGGMPQHCVSRDSWEVSVCIFVLAKTCGVLVWEGGGRK